MRPLSFPSCFRQSSLDSLDGPGLSVVDGHPGEDEADAGEDGVDPGAHEAAEDPPDEVEAELEQPDGGRGHPHVEDGDEGEDGRPQQRRRDGHQRRQQPVEPQLGAREHDEGHAVHHLEALRVVRLGQNVVEAKLELIRKEILMLEREIKVRGEIFEFF